MKTFLCLSLVASALLMAGCASSRPVADASPTPPSALVTGSYLPQPVSLDAPILAGINNVSVLTAEEMRNTGANTLPRALFRTGMSR